MTGIERCPASPARLQPVLVAHDEFSTAFQFILGGFAFRTRGHLSSTSTSLRCRDTFAGGLVLDFQKFGDCIHSASPEQFLHYE